MALDTSDITGEELESRYFRSSKELDTRLFRDVTGNALWSASSSRTDHGIDKLFDDDASTFWQSDATMPHTITAHFSKKASLRQFSMFLPGDLDESYTPKTVSLKAGTGLHDLIQCGTWDLSNPAGWCDFQLDHAREDHVLKCFCLQICISENHLNGKDSRVRAIKLFAERSGEPFPSLF